MKKILVLHYSQTGQLTRLVDSILRPLQQCDDVKITIEQLRPRQPYPFPWPFFEFFDIFPECVYLDPPELEPFQFDPAAHYDLILLSYQVWFLSPSLPITAFLLSPEARQVLRDRPVITIIGCRNMWLMAQEKVKKILDDLGATLCDNLVLVDRDHSVATFFTTPRWMFTGKKDRYLGLFPEPGIDPEEIEQASRFGQAIVEGLQNSAVERKETLLTGLGAVKVDPRYIASEKAGHRSFRAWGRLLRLIGKQGQRRRKPFLLLYFLFLLTLLLTLMPLVLLVRRLLAPLRPKATQQQIDYFEQPSGSDRSRCPPTTNEDSEEK